MFPSKVYSNPVATHLELMELIGDSILPDPKIDDFNASLSIDIDDANSSEGGDGTRNVFLTHRIHFGGGARRRSTNTRE